MYAENLMDVSRHELSWECDYKREARCMKVFGSDFNLTFFTLIPYAERCVCDVPEMLTYKALGY